MVKGHEYHIADFLFNKNLIEKQDFDKIMKKIDERGNELKYILLYLSPSDYHRYHSPALFTTNYRRHIPGTLYPVMPSFVRKVPETFNANERVILFGEWAHGFFTTSFIGATNVGSMVVNFDKNLQTNNSKFKSKEPYDLNYLTMTELDGIFKKNIIIKKKALGKNQEDVVNIIPDLKTFDVKDMIDTDAGETKYIYNENQENDLKYNLLNSFNPQDSQAESELNDYQENLKKKLENPEDYVQNYTMTNKGILLEKGQEIGYFKMGSSIMLIFETPKGSNFSVKEGQKVQLGNRLLKTE